MAECAFCGLDKRLSLEHVWPEWLLKHVPPPDPSERKIRSIGVFSSITGLDDIQDRDEGPRSTPVLVRAVCEPCNNKWMSDLENEAKPVLVPLLDGRDLRLKSEEADVLRRWAFKTVTMIEYTAGDRRAVTKEQRRYFFEHRDVPPGVRMWIGRFHEQDRPPDLGFLHRTLNGRPVDQPDAEGTTHLQQTTLFMGCIVVAVITRAHSRVSLPLSIPVFGRRLTKLMAGRPIDMTALTPLTLTDVEQLASALQGMSMANGNRLPGGFF